MSILKIRSKQEALAIQFTGDNRKALIDFVGDNHVSDNTMQELMKEDFSPELFEEEPPEDFFGILRITVTPLIPSPYMLQLYPQDYLVKKKADYPFDEVYEFSVLGNKEFQYIGTFIQKNHSVMKFTGKNKKSLVQWVGKQCIHAWEKFDPEKEEEFRMVIDPVKMDIYSVFLCKEDWLIKEIHEPYLLTTTVAPECSTYYQFEAIPDEIFRKNYEITHENVPTNTTLTVLNRPKMRQRTRRRWDNPLIPNFEGSLVDA